MKAKVVERRRPRAQLKAPLAGHRMREREERRESVRAIATWSTCTYPEEEVEGEHQILDAGIAAAECHGEDSMITESKSEQKFKRLKVVNPRVHSRKHNPSHTQLTSKCFQ